MTQLHAGESLSIWMDNTVTPLLKPLKENISTEVCIIGGGIGGLTTAYLLIKEGKKVCVLEDFEIGSGQTGKSSAHLTVALDTRYFDLEKNYGVKGTKLIAESQREALKKIERIIIDEQIDCEFQRVPGFLFAPSESPEDILFRELQATHRAGIYTHMVSRAPIESMDTGASLCFPDQVQFHPQKYIAGLVEKILQSGGQIYTHTRAIEVYGGEKAFIKTKDGFHVLAQSVVVATHSPINNIFAIHTKQAAYRTYVLGFRIKRGQVAAGLYWDTLSRYHYIRKEDLASDTHELLLIGGEDHKTGQNDHPEICYKKLENWARENFPFLKNIIYRWSGQIMKSVDGLAFLGHNPLDEKNVYIITGDSGNGITNCTIGGMIITDQIMGRKNPWGDLYSPSRINLFATASYIKENANAVLQLGEYFKNETEENLDFLPSGEGMVIHDGLKMITAYRDLAGNLEFKSAVCPHLGCVVNWNRVEKSWDCPCHGSRFDCHGQVLEGPATSDLNPIDEFDFEIWKENRASLTEKREPDAPLFPA